MYDQIHLFGYFWTGNGKSKHPGILHQHPQIFLNINFNQK